MNKLKYSKNVLHFFKCTITELNNEDEVIVMTEEPLETKNEIEVPRGKEGVETRENNFIKIKNHWEESHK